MANRSLNSKISEIEEKISKIQKHRQELSEKPPRKHWPKKKPIPKIKALYHPKLDFVVGQMMASPYMADPNYTYPRAVYKVPVELKTLQDEGYKKFKDIPKEKKPYDAKVMKEMFVKEIINYNATYLVTNVSIKSDNHHETIHS